MVSQARRRVAAIDWMRGLVMILMTIDHASDAFNGGRVFSDAAWMHKAGTVLPTAQFLTRWITHLCAPTFVFLAGVSLALSIEHRQKRGESPLSIDKHIVSRGLFIAALDPLWMTLAFFGGYHHTLLQVLYAIGMSLVLMAGLRRLPTWALVGGALAILAVVDFLVGRAFDHPSPGGTSPPWIVGALLSGGRFGRVIIGYPLLPWLSIMMLGWALGRGLSRAEEEFRPEKWLLFGGLVALGTFGVLRGLDGFGNAGLHRDDGSLVQWLHVSKYPPSLTYCGLELGIMALGLAAFFHVERRGGAGSPVVAGLGVLGANALFYYLLHAHLLIGASHLLGLHAKLGLGATYLSAALCAVVLGFACRAYAGYKRGHDNLVTRWV